MDLGGGRWGCRIWEPVEKEKGGGALDLMGQVDVRQVIRESTSKDGVGMSVWGRGED